jgi:hypothetical protein
MLASSSPTTTPTTSPIGEVVTTTTTTTPPPKNLPKICKLASLLPSPLEKLADRAYPQYELVDLTT